MIFLQHPLREKIVMQINSDFSKVALVKPQDYQWVTSPGGEVERVMLDRIGAENARATSLVKYLPHSTFPKHLHPQGEEILVLSGIFTENSNTHYPAGWYMRNPHNSGHTPSSEQGAVIFVKLRQMQETETTPVRINTHDLTHWKKVDEHFICPLFQSEHEYTYLEKLDPLQYVVSNATKGIEILVISGQLDFNNSDQTQRTLEPGSWVRLPPKATIALQAGAAGATLYIKSNHLLTSTIEDAEKIE
jgi:anti-sigma factor ChrR (cupin superfamily)